jgi:hypothetical protein
LPANAGTVHMNSSAATKRPNEPFFIVVIVEHPPEADFFCPRENYSSEVLSYRDISIKVSVLTRLLFPAVSCIAIRAPKVGIF